MTITEEMKLKMFEKVLELERNGNMPSYSINYTEQANGAFIMLQILGLSKEYIHWSDDKLFQ